MKEKPPAKWYHKDSSLIVGFLVAGPLMLPLLLSNPRLSVKSKIFWMIVILIITVILAKCFASMVNALKENYKLLESLINQ